MGQNALVAAFGYDEGRPPVIVSRTESNDTAASSTYASQPPKEGIEGHVD
jgi:hypothetical protein